MQAASCCIPPAFNLLIIYYYTPVTYYMLLWQVFLRFLVHNCFRCLPWSNAARKEYFDLELFEVRQCCSTKNKLRNYYENFYSRASNKRTVSLFEYWTFLHMYVLNLLINKISKNDLPRRNSTKFSGHRYVCLEQNFVY